MYNFLLFSHSFLRWVALAVLLIAIYRAATGYFGGRPFTKADNAFRHWTATLTHIQLIFGILLYVQRPLTGYFWKNFSTAIGEMEIAFFGIWHIVLMLATIGVITTGSSMAKRQADDRAKFRTMLIWFGIGLLILLVAIPWPFSPLAQRPYLRPL